MKTEHTGGRGVRAVRWRAALLAAVAAAWAYAPPGASAQEAAAGRPYLGLFGGVEAPGPPATRRPGPALVYSVRVFEQVAFGGTSGRGDAASGASDYSAADVSLSRLFSQKRLSVELGGGAQLRAYHDGRGARFDQQWLVANVETKLTKRTLLSLANRAAYAASYAPRSPLGDALGPGDAGVAQGGVELSALRNLSLMSAARVARRMGRRTEANASYSFGVVTYLDRDETVTTNRVAAGVTRQMRRDLSLDLGYDYTRVVSGRADGALSTLTHEARVTLRFSPSSLPSTSIVAGLIPTLAGRQASVARAASGQGADAPYAGRVGTIVGVDHRVARRVRAGLVYQRALYSDQGYVQPTFVQTGGGRLEAALSRRVSIGASMAYSTGLASSAAPGASLSRFDGAVRAEVRTSRSLAVSVEYQRSDYRRRGVAGPTGAQPGGQTFRIGFTVPGS